MKKRILSLLLLAAVMASLLAPAVQAAAPANRFYDLNGDSFMSVEPLRLMGIMDGFSDGNFRPNSQLTRAEVLAAALGGSFSNGAIAGKEAIRDE